MENRNVQCLFANDEAQRSRLILCLCLEIIGTFSYSLDTLLETIFIRCVFWIHIHIQQEAYIQALNGGVDCCTTKHMTRTLYAIESVIQTWMHEQTFVLMLLNVASATALSCGTPELLKEMSNVSISFSSV